MEMKSIACVVLIGITLTGVFFGGMVIVNYNDLVASKNQADTEWSNIWVQVERKISLIPQIQNIVETYAAYEQNTILTLIELRTQWMNSNDSLIQRDNISDQITQELTQVVITLEDNPDLQAVTLFEEWLVEVAGTENRITNAKLDYNEAVQDYNTKLMSFPGNWVGGMFGFEVMDLYDARILAG
jgi:LemA protein